MPQLGISDSVDSPRKRGLTFSEEWMEWMVRWVEGEEVGGREGEVTGPST